MDGSAYSLAGPEGAPRDREGLGRTEMPGLVIRRLTSHYDYEQAVELQRITWGETFRDVVPAAILKVTQRVGGVTAGAFNADGVLLGFVYGLTGFHEGRVVHWSHMLGVRPELRDRGIGKRLKEYQRELLLEAGVDWIYWTFDPLVARNAHLNFNRLHVEVREYVPDMYGDTGSELHAFGTDRFVVAWPVRGATTNGNESTAAGRQADIAEAPILNRLDGRDLAEATRTYSHAAVLVEVPPDVELLSNEEARNWRDATRRSFMTALQAGYEVTGFMRDPAERCVYILSHSD